MTARLKVLTVNQKLITETCYECGVLFAMGEEFYNECQRQKNKKLLYCPAGHPQHYVGKSDETLRREAEAREADAWKEARRQADRADSIDRSRAALKGQLTKTKKRISKGTCPCCKRHFTNVERHMKSQHPSYENPAGEEES